MEITVGAGVGIPVESAGADQHRRTPEVELRLLGAPALHRTGVAVGRFVSLSRRTQAEGHPWYRFQQRANREITDRDRRLCREEQGPTLDPARRNTLKDAQEITTVLRLA